MFMFLPVLFKNCWCFNKKRRNSIVNLVNNSVVAISYSNFILVYTSQHLAIHVIYWIQLCPLRLRYKILFYVTSKPDKVIIIIITTPKSEKEM